MGNEPDAAGTRDNLEVIRELLRRLEEAAQSRTLASPEPTQSTTRELASLRQRTPPSRLSPSSPPGTRQYYSPLEAFPIDAMTRWRLPIAAIGGYTLGVVTTLATVTYYGNIARFAGNLFGPGQPQVAKAVTPPTATPVRTERAAAKEAPARTVTASEPPSVPAASARPVTPAIAPAAAPASPPGTAQAPAPAASTQSAAVKPAAPEKPAPPSTQEKVVSTAEPVQRTDQAIPGAQSVGGARAVSLKLAPRIDVHGGARARFPVTLDPLPSDADALLLVVRGVPEEIALSQGSAIGNEIWLIPAHLSGTVEFTVANAVTGTFDVSTELVTIEGRMLAQARTRIVSTPTALAAAAPADPGASEKIDADTVRRLTARGELLLDTGDIGAARVVLERAAAAGSAIAALRLGETYDPVILRRSGTQASPGDEVQALRWYEQAERLGSPRAAERLSELRKR